MIAFVLIISALTFVGTGLDFAQYRFWAPKYENAKREVFVNTQSFVEGKTDYLSRLRLEYTDATAERKKALRTLILQEAATVDKDKLPVDLQLFLEQL